MRFRLRSLLVTCAALGSIAFVSSAAAQVSVTLVSPDKSVQPGHPVSVALRMEHNPRWHSYWVNAGTGYPTELTWDLPSGWVAGDIQWPVPMLIKNAEGHVTGHGYDGLTYLPVTLSTPPDVPVGGHVQIKAQVSWLMCADVCIPGAADVALQLPVADGPPQSNDAVRTELARVPMPQEPAGWQVNADRAGDAVTLHLVAPAGIRNPHFFSDNEFIQYGQPQQASVEGAVTSLLLPLAENPSIPTRLTGIFAYTNSSGDYRGVRVDVPLSASPTVFSAAGADGTARAALSARAPSIGILMLALMGGLVLNLMPCVFPVLGIKILGFVNEAGSDRRRVALHGVMFSVGVLLSFWVLAGLLATLRASGQQLGWGFQLQSAPFVFSLAVIMLAFALSLSGVFDFGLRATGIGSHLQSRQGLTGSFFTGVLATVVATPCSAPFLAPALGSALALPTLQSFVVFTCIAVGLAAPYLLLSLFPQAVSALPRPGRWLETFKQAMAFPLYATAAFLMWVLAGQTSESDLLSALLGLTIVAMAAWLYGRYNRPAVALRQARLAMFGALFLLVAGCVFGWPHSAKASDVVWEPWSPERIAQLQAERRPIYVDFTARWCATCQANKRLVFASDAVKQVLRQRKVALLKADWTNSDPLITAELLKWNRSAVPFNLVYLPGVAQPKILPEILAPSIVLGAIRGS
jgi:thiol:disulfide interchange protein DsbD